MATMATRPVLVGPCVVALLGLATAAAVPTPAEQPRVSICLNGDWQRAPGGAGDRVPADGWQTVRVPEFHADALRDCAWFRLDFVVPEVFPGAAERAYLRFGRVRHHAKVWMNDRAAGENYGGRAPFECDVTALARPGQPNRLEVCVRSCGGAFAMPGRAFGPEAAETVRRLSTHGAYVDLATIAEDVSLELRPALALDDVRIVTSVRHRTLTVRSTLRNDTPTARRVRLTHRVFDGDRPVLDLPAATVAVPAGGQSGGEVQTAWADPALWAPGSPTLYHLETEVVPEGDTSGRDRLVSRFGFRELWTEGRQIVLNGKPLRLLAYWQPEASGRSLWTLRLAAVQALGFNTVHNHAEQREPAFYDVADEMGLLVWDADFCGGPLGTTPNVDTTSTFPDVEAELGRQYPLWAREVANHPSVAVMMVGCLVNADVAARLAAVYRRADPTRLLMANGTWAGEAFDLGAYAHKLGCFDADPLAQVVAGYTAAAGRADVRPAGTPVPLVNSEAWYETSQLVDRAANTWSNGPDATVATVTAAAFDYLTPTPLAGLNLYSQVGCARDWAAVSRPVANWPSRSGRHQHATTMATGGLTFAFPEHVNLADPARRPFVLTPAGETMRQKARAFTGREAAVATARRPQAMVAVTRRGGPVADAIVYVVARRGVVANCEAMRTDAAGTAWFQLRDAGEYTAFCRQGAGWRQLDFAAAEAPLDLEHGGHGLIQPLALPLD
jgi:hypothetical protein